MVSGEHTVRYAGCSTKRGTRCGGRGQTAQPQATRTCSMRVSIRGHNALSESPDQKCKPAGTTQTIGSPTTCSISIRRGGGPWVRLRFGAIDLACVPAPSKSFWKHIVASFLELRLTKTAKSSNYIFISNTIRSKEIIFLPCGLLMHVSF